MNLNTKERKTLGEFKPGEHTYEVDARDPAGHRATVTVHARNRDQAASLAKRAGLAVFSVNMVG